MLSEQTFPAHHFVLLFDTSAMASQDSEASRRMHDYLLNKQRRKEEYWIRKYGRVRAEQRAQMTAPGA